MILVLTWGMIGFCANQAMISWPIDRLALVSIPLAFIGSLLITRVATSLVARFLPTNETYARRRHELLGSIGEAMYPIDTKFGMIHGKDDRGETFQVPCRLESDQPTIPKGTRVQLVGYNAKEQMFFVVPATESTDSAQTPLRRTA
jgi:membrane protein implicated in regulation of membrane protease activity